MEEVKFAPASVLVNYNNNRKLRLWCSAIGTVEFDSVNSDRQIICYTERNGNRMPIVFNEYGELYSEYDDDRECCLFPSRRCKDWRQWRLVMIQEGDIVVNVQTDKVYMVMTAKVSEDPNLTTYKLVDSESNVLEEAEVNAIIPLLRFATKQEIRMYYEEVRIYTIAKKTDRTIIVNLFAGPGAGNSTGAAYIFSMLKMNGFRCEYVSEFAKDKVWEENNTALNCQFYVAGKQIYKVSRVIGKVNIVITDSPILLSAYYSKDNSLKNAILYEHNKYENLNIFIERDKAYDEVGRLQNYDEACKIDNDLKDMLNSYNQEYVSVKGNKDGYDKIVDMITKKWDDKYKPTKNKM